MKDRLDGFENIEARELIRETFDAIAAEGAVTNEELVAALYVAAWEFEAESYNASPFYRLLARMST